MPTGAILRASVNRRHWLTSGCRADELAVPYSSSTVLLSRGEAPVRFGQADTVRLAGLVWPEARERLANGAWVTRDGLGRGQVILFATSPVFRGSFLGTARLLGNSVVLGPGLGASSALGW